MTEAICPNGHLSDNAEICDQCGEVYLDSTITAQLLDLARAAAQAGVEVDIRHYAA